MKFLIRKTFETQFIFPVAVKKRRNEKQLIKSEKYGNNTELDEMNQTLCFVYYRNKVFCCWLAGFCLWLL